MQTSGKAGSSCWKNGRGYRFYQFQLHQIIELSMVVSWFWRYRCYWGKSNLNTHSTLRNWLSCSDPQPKSGVNRFQEHSQRTILWSTLPLNLSLVVSERIDQGRVFMKSIYRALNSIKYINHEIARTFHLRSYAGTNDLDGTGTTTLLWNTTNSYQLKQINHLSWSFGKLSAFSCTS